MRPYKKPSNGVTVYMFVFKVHKYLIRKYVGIYCRILVKNPHYISKTGYYLSLSHYSPREAWTWWKHGFCYLTESEAAYLGSGEHSKRFWYAIFVHKIRYVRTSKPNLNPGGACLYGKKWYLLRKIIIISFQFDL